MGASGPTCVKEVGVPFLFLTAVTFPSSEESHGYLFAVGRTERVLDKYRVQGVF